MQTQQQVLYTAGIAGPSDLTGQMTGAIVASTMLLHQRGRLQNAEVKANLAVAERLYNVTMELMGVLDHPRARWHSDSFFDDRLWAVRPLPLFDLWFLSCR